MTEQWKAAFWHFDAFRILEGDGGNPYSFTAGELFACDEQKTIPNGGRMVDLQKHN